MQSKLIAAFFLFCLSISINTFAGDIEDIVKKSAENTKQYLDSIDNTSNEYSTEEMNQLIKNAFQNYKTNILPEVEKWKNKIDIDNESFKVTFSDNSTLSKQFTESFSHDERIYIFMSSSVPKQVWKEYAYFIDQFKITNNAVMLLRGCIGDCHKIFPTVNFIADILQRKGTTDIKDKYLAQIWLDPLLFGKYQIQEVPCFIYGNGLELNDQTLSEGLQHNIKKEPVVYKSCGDWSFDYHLRNLYAQSKNPSLKTIIDKVEKYGFYKR